jgi:hypothetical protein
MAAGLWYSTSCTNIASMDDLLVVIAIGNLTGAVFNHIRVNVLENFDIFL